MIAVFLTPAIFAYLVVFIYPTIRTTFMSFFVVDNITDAISKWEFTGLANYFTLVLTFAVMLTSGVKGKSAYRAIIYLPNVVSAVAMGTMWIQYVYSTKYGLLKKLFTFLGFENLAGIQWTSPDMIFTSLLIAYCFGMVGYFLLIFMAAMEGIPISFYEAATIAGAAVGVILTVIVVIMFFLTSKLLKDDKLEY